MNASASEKKTFTPPLITFALLQFLFYAFMFWLLYKTDSSGSPMSWRIAAVLATVAALVTSFVPVFASDRVEDGEFNLTYISGLFPFVIYLIYKIVSSYLNWDFSFTKKDISDICQFYIFGAPVASLMFLTVFYPEY